MGLQTPVCEHSGVLQGGNSKIQRPVAPTVAPTVARQFWSRFAVFHFFAPPARRSEVHNDTLSNDLRCYLYTAIYSVNFFAPPARRFEVHNDTLHSNLRCYLYTAIYSVIFSRLRRGDLRYTTISWWRDVTRRHTRHNIRDLHQITLSNHFINTLYQNTLSKHSIKTHYQNTSSNHFIKTIL